jgi:predicted nuclease of predicted toxin-antitoxin system
VPIKILLDQGLPRDAAVELRQAGVECRHVGDVGMAAASDPDILEWAQARGCVVVTLDADFHALLAVTGASGPSVIRIRQQGLDGPAVAALIREVVKRYRDDLETGCMVTVKDRKTTCRMLSSI